MVTIRRYDAQVSDQIGAPVLARGADQFSGGQDLARGLDAVADTAFDWQDEIDTADAKSADAAFTERVNDLLYNDQTGFMYQTGSNAVNRRAALDSALGEARDEIVGKLSPAARRRAETAMQARLESATQRINQHTASERRTYLNDASQARITASLNSGVADPSQIERQLGVAMGELNDLAAREGWSPEVLQEKRAEAQDQVYMGALNRMLNVSPESALEFARTNRDKFSGAALAEIERDLVPIAEERIGVQIGRQATQGGGVAGNNPFTSLIDKHEGGGNYSTLFGHAQRAGGALAGVDVSKMTIGEALEFSAADGVYGQYQKRELGYLATPMGRWQIVGSTLRSAARDMGLPMDTVFSPAIQDKIAIHLARGRLAGPLTAEGKRTAMRAEWEGFKNVSDAELDQAIGWLEANGASTSGEEPSTADAMQMILNQTEGRPRVREAALREFELQSGVAKQREAETREEALNAGFALIETGGSISDLDAATRTALGPETLTRLRQLESAKRTGERIETDDALFVQLHEMAATDPQAFMQADPMEWRMKLNDADFQRFVTMRSGMLAEAAGGEPAATPTPVSASTIMTLAKRQAEAAGIDTTPDTGSDDARIMAQMQSRLVRWQTAFIEENGAQPTQQEIADRIGRELVEVVVNPPGLRNQYSGSLAGVEEVEPGDLANTDITIADLDVPTTVIAEQLAEMEAEGIAITAEALLDRLTDLLARAGQL